MPLASPIDIRCHQRRMTGGELPRSNGWRRKRCALPRGYDRAVSRSRLTRSIWSRIWTLRSAGCSPHFRAAQLIALHILVAHHRRRPLADFEECHLADRRASAHAGDATRVARSQALHLFRARAGTADSRPERRPAPAKRLTQPPSKCGPSIHQDGIAPKGIFRELTLNHRLACSLNVWT